MENDLYAHTLDIRNWISVKEAQELCQRYNVKLANETVITNVKIAGINQIYLKRNKAYANGKKIDRYGIDIQLNVGRLLKKSKVAMTVINNKSVTQMIKTLNNIFSKDFGFNFKHSDSSKWTISRLDCGVDLKLCTDNPTILREYIRLLHDSFDVNNSKNIKYSDYKTGKSWDEIKYESITLTTSGEATNDQLYKYNIYYKLQQLLAYAKDKGITLSQDEIDEVANVIRIEKQINQVGKVFGKSSSLASLLDESLTEKLMKNIVKDMLLLFGKGDYLSDTEALSRIYQSKYSEAVQDDLSIMYENIKCVGYQKYIETEIGILKVQGASKCEIEETIKSIKAKRKKLEDIGISIATTEIAPALTNINTLLEQQMIKTKKPRKKGKFGAIYEVPEPSGKTRFKCNASLYNFDGTKKRYSVASSVGGTREECEKKIYKTFIKVFNNNISIAGNNREAFIDCYEYALEDLENFKTVITSADVITTVDDCIKKINLYLAKVRPDEYSPFI